MNRQELFHGDFHLHSAASYPKLGIKNQALSFSESLVHDETAAMSVSRAEQGYRGASMIFPFPFVTIMKKSKHCEW